MQMTKKVLSVVLAVMMVVSMMVVGTVAASAYDSVTDVYYAMQAGGNVTLDKDFAYNGSLSVPAGKTVVLDLAGHELSSLNNCAIYNLGTLTVKDSVGGGKLTAQEMCVIAFDGATTTIESGTYTAKDNAVFGTNGSTGRGGTTWYINGGTFNGTIQTAGYVACGIYAPNNDTWNVNGGTFNITNGVGVAQRAGTVNIADGVVFNVTGDGTEGRVGDSRVVLPSGTGIVYDSEAAYPGQTDADKTVVTGGTFNTEKAAAATVMATTDTNSRVEISGGSFDKAPEAGFVSGDTYTANNRTYVGIDGVITTEADLKAAAAAGGSYVLADDITVTSAALTNTTTTKKTGGYNYDDRLVVGADFELDGAGHKITAGTGTDDKTLFYPTGDTVKITMSDLTIDGNNTAARAVCGYQSSGGANTNEITLTNVTVKNFKGTTYAGPVYAFGGTQLTLNDCTVVNNDITVDPNYPHANGDVWGGGASKITINGGTYDEVYANGAASNVAIDGGAVVDTLNVEVGNAVCVTVADATINNVAAESGTTGAPLNANQIVYTAASTVTVPDGYKKVDNGDGTFTIALANYVAKVGTAKFETIGEAIAAAQDGDTIELLSDVNIGANWYRVNKDVTFDLGGYTVTGNDSFIVVGAGADVTIKNGTVTSDVSGDYVLYADGNLTIADDATIVASAARGNAVIVRAGGQLDVEGTIESGYYSIAGFGTAVVNVYEGASITSTDASAISGNGSGGNEGYTFNVMGGTLTSTNDVAIYHPNQGTLNITGGTITGATAIYIKSGTTDVSATGTSITGATITGTGAQAAMVHSGNGCSPTGDAIVIENCGYPGGVPDIEISGGTIVSQNAQDVGSYAYGTDAQTGNAYEAITGFVSGGTFSNAVPADYCATGFEPKDNGNGTYGVQVKDNPLDDINVLAADINDNNAFGLTGIDYNVGALLGVQKKGDVAAVTSENGQEKAGEDGYADARFIAVLDTDTLKAAEDYGFVLAKVDNTKDYDNIKFNNLTATEGNGQKVVSAKGTWNNVCGNVAYGDPSDNSTAYKYITCAVNGIADGEQIVARFYVKLDGKYYYAKYAKDNYQAGYTGALVAYSNVA